MFSFVVTVAASVLAVSCSFDRSGISNSDASGGISDAPPDVIDANTACDGLPRCLTSTQIETCDNGMPLQRSCSFACTDNAGSPRCGMFNPSNNTVEGWRLDTAPVTIANNITLIFDTDTGEISLCSGGNLRDPGTGTISGINYQHPEPAPSPGVFIFDDFVVPMGTVVRAIGTRGFAIFSANTVDVAGQIFVSGGLDACDFTAACDAGDAPVAGDDPSCGGPGASNGGRRGISGQGTGAGGAGVESPMFIECGGGGGGFGGSGGRGGSNSGGLGGSVHGLMTLDPIFGGSGGGGGADFINANFWASGGGGGGAMQLTAWRSITITGELHAGGGGGAAGGGLGGAGGGGGAGGAILLEAPLVTVSGDVAANGGGGGAGGGTNWGQIGGTGLAPALGGTGSNDGGDGGWQSMPDGTGGAPANNDDTNDGGGGGGGVGRVYVRHAFGGWTPGGTITPTAVSADDIAQ